MALTPGTRLGVYEFIASIGEGGMGQVFRARDTKLKRQVAIKILPPLLTADHDRLARFQREAEVLASLNHPNIAAIYGLEESGGVSALVMELVEGDDLSQRIARGAIPLDEVLPIAKQIADALEAAHDQGINHRDLKPALSSAPPPTCRRSRRAGRPSIGAPTFGPSAPWVYEMLSGRRLFEGETVSDMVAAVLRDEIDWTALPAATPEPVRRLLERCLDRDVKRRSSGHDRRPGWLRPSSSWHSRARTGCGSADELLQPRTMQFRRPAGQSRSYHLSTTAATQTTSILRTG